MSVLNKMLRDLEQRQSEPAASAAAIPVNSERSNTLVFILLLSGLLLLVAYFARSTATSSESVSLPLSSAVVQASDAVVADDAVMSDPVKAVHSEQTTTVEEKPATPDVTSASAVDDTKQIAVPDVIAVIRQADTAPAVVTAGIQQVSEKASLSRLEVARNQPTTAEQVEALTQQAVVAAQAGQLAQALQLWQQVQQLQPGLATAYLAQARLWLQQGQPMQAELIARQGLQQGILSAELQFLIAQQAASRADWRQVDILLPAQFELVQHPEYYGLKATALQQQGQQQAALHWYQQLLQIQPQQARWWLGAALAYDSLQQYEAAQLHYRQALKWGENLSSASQQFIQQRLAAIE